MENAILELLKKYDAFHTKCQYLNNFRNVLIVFRSKQLSGFRRVVREDQIIILSLLALGN